VIVAGDFNTFWGEHEIYLFTEALDFVLHTQNIEIMQFDVPDVRFSDHRPLICDFRVRS
jgi:endonuclease/exonuclease/phosphatase (EEP) superfamily protein YafD